MRGFIIGGRGSEVAVRGWGWSFAGDFVFSGGE